MADYFTPRHFKLLDTWKGQKKERSNPEHQRVYDELSKAYKLTESWADQLQRRLFPLGRMKILKKPTTQASKFSGYTWARIYPSDQAPDELAYTVGIDKRGFVVKIDTVNLDESSPTRKAYESLRGAPDNSSPVVAILSVEDGLDKSLEQLVSWSADAIAKFPMSYDDVVQRLDIQSGLDDEELLKHFDVKPAFKTFRASWSPEEKARFCRLARAVHDAGLDWWHVDIANEVRFGRKNRGAERAEGVLAVVRGVGNRVIVWRRKNAGLSASKREPLTDESVARIEETLVMERASLDELLPLETERPGLWPDQLREEAVLFEPDDDDEPASPSVSVHRQPFNRIYYGPPGTGKTFEVSKLLRRDYEQKSSSVSDEEWRTQFIAERIAPRKWWEGAALALYDLGGTASVSQLLDHSFIQAIAVAKRRTDYVRQTLWSTLQERTVDESTTVKQKTRFSPQIFDKNHDSIWHFVGDWQDVCADLVALADEYRAGPPSSGVLRHYSFVTFHQSYGYEEFVEGLRPVLAGDGDAGNIEYEIRPGVFKDLCNKARLAPDQRFAMVIDEINRGNISKIFGELITLIEPDKREDADNALSVILPYSGESFSVPSNIDVIGTMNTADRSLALLDTALRRRFDFVPIMPDARDSHGAPLGGLRVTAGGQSIEIPALLAAINHRVEALYDRDHCVGHAYFASLSTFRDGDDRMTELAQIFRNRILPLLEEYFFEDWQKIRLVLADNQKPRTAQFVLESQDREDDLDRLFGSGHGLDSHATKRRYTVQDAAFSDPSAYVGIYEPPSA